MRNVRLASPLYRLLAGTPSVAPWTFLAMACACDAQPAATEVHAITAAMGRYCAEISATSPGQIQPLRQAELRSAVGGRVSSLHARRGGRVRKNERIATLSVTSPNDARFTSSLLRPLEHDVVAPYNGVVVAMAVEEGDDVLPGTLVAQIADTSEFRARSSVSEFDSALVTTGMRASLVLDAYPVEKLYGGVIEVAPVVTVDRGDSGVEILVKVQADARLRIGMRGTVYIETTCYEDVLGIPKSAVYGEPPYQFAFVAAGGRAQRRSVRIRASNRNSMIVEDGIVPGEQVIMEPGDVDLVDGALIKLSEEPKTE